MLDELSQLPAGKKIYFVSDLHLGSPNFDQSLEREKKMVSWLSRISKDAYAIFFLGDIFDFWFEYKHVIPKGYTRFIGKLVELKELGIQIYFFTGNHDMWMFNYFPTELQIPIFRSSIEIEVNEKKFMIGHGDGLGPGDYSYKFLKKIFSNKFCQWLFAGIHPGIGFRMAQYWSRKSRISNSDEDIPVEKDRLIQFCTEKEKISHFDFYIFGHRHKPFSYNLNGDSRYYNLGDWINHFTYGRFDGDEFELLTYEH